MGDGGGQRQQQGEASAGARLVVEQHATAQRVDFGAHHVKADAAVAKDEVADQARYSADTLKSDAPPLR